MLGSISISIGNYGYKTYTNFTQIEALFYIFNKLWVLVVPCEKSSNDYSIFHCRLSFIDEYLVCLYSYKQSYSEYLSFFQFASIYLLIRGEYESSGPMVYVPRSLVDIVNFYKLILHHFISNRKSWESHCTNWCICRRLNTWDI